MADKFKSIAKGGWHPEKNKERDPYDYGSNSKPKHGIRENFKGVNTVASLVGKGKPKDDYDSSTHRSAPLSTLKDPDTFGPPPKRTDTSSFGGVSAANAAPPSPARPKPSTANVGLGGSLGKQYGESIQERRERLQREAEEEAEAEARRKAEPYRLNTTGLSTAGFAPPPKVRSDGFADHDSRAVAVVKPSLPPRLPPRTTAGAAASPPPTYEQAETQANPAAGVMNPDAMHRLANAGVNVPALGLAAHPGAPPPPPARQQAAKPATIAAPVDQVNELQARFARLGNAAQGGPVQSNPASVLPSNPLDKKPAPPPPRKKDNLHSAASGEAPPPVPMSSKPRF